MNRTVSKTLSLRGALRGIAISIIIFAHFCQFDSRFEKIILGGYGVIE
jgi:hypothetical protein